MSTDLGPGAVLVDLGLVPVGIGCSRIGYDLHVGRWEHQVQCAVAKAGPVIVHIGQGIVAVAELPLAEPVIAGEVVVEQGGIVAAGGGGPEARYPYLRLD